MAGLQYSEFDQDQDAREEGSGQTTTAFWVSLFSRKNEV